MVTDVEAKRFLNENGSWYRRYLPEIQNALAAQIQANPGKPAPSVATVLAVIKQESNGQPWAVRYEPGFRKFLEGSPIVGTRPKTFGNAISKETELVMRSSSFGLMQLMGQTLREHGFENQYLTECCDSKLGIMYGIKHLCKLMKKYQTLDEVFAAYNAGTPRRGATGKFSNQEYVDSANRFKEHWDYILNKNW